LEKKRALRLSIRILVILTIVIFVVSLYNLMVFLTTAISGESFGMKLNRNESTGDWVLTFSANPRNNGVLPVSIYLKITILDLKDNVIAENSTKVYIAAGSSHPFSFTLTIPSELVQGGELQGDEGSMKFQMSVTTFGDLVGFTQLMKIGGRVGT